MLAGIKRTYQLETIRPRNAEGVFQPILIRNNPCVKVVAIRPPEAEQVQLAIPVGQKGERPKLGDDGVPLAFDPLLNGRREASFGEKSRFARRRAETMDISPGNACIEAALDTLGRRDIDSRECQPSISHPFRNPADENRRPVQSPPGARRRRKPPRPLPSCPATCSAGPAIRRPAKS